MVTIAVAVVLEVAAAAATDAIAQDIGGGDDAALGLVVGIGICTVGHDMGNSKGALKGGGCVSVRD